MPDTPSRNRTSRVLRVDREDHPPWHSEPNNPHSRNDECIGIEGGKGPAEALKLVRLLTPNPGPSQILVRLVAADVNQPDLMQREGRYPLPPGTPETLGLELAGDVVALGEGSALENWRFGV
jgi:hypothetical protein